MLLRRFQLPNYAHSLADKAAGSQCCPHVRDSFARRTSFVRLINQHRSSQFPPLVLSILEVLAELLAELLVVAEQRP